MSRKAIWGLGIAGELLGFGVALGVSFARGLAHLSLLSMAGTVSGYGSSMNDRTYMLGMPGIGTAVPMAVLLPVTVSGVVHAMAGRRGSRLSIALCAAGVILAESFVALVLAIEAGGQVRLASPALLYGLGLPLLGLVLPCLGYLIPIRLRSKGGVEMGQEADRFDLDSATESGPGAWGARRDGVDRAESRRERALVLMPQYLGGLLGLAAEVALSLAMVYVLVRLDRRGKIDFWAALLVTVAHTVLLPMLVPLGVHIAARITGSRGSFWLALLGTVLFEALMAQFSFRIDEPLPFAGMIVVSVLGGPMLPVLGYNLVDRLRRGRRNLSSRRCRRSERGDANQIH